MIRLVRGNIPSRLAEKGPGKTEELVVAVLSDWEAYSRAKDPQKPTFSGSTYGDSDIKTPMLEQQRYKCAYCEHRIGAAQSGDVEHYRPKAAFKRFPKDAYIRPGYFWLAYDWHNLLVACRLCNGGKSAIFPVAVESNRARRPSDDLSRERPALLDPYVDDPAAHIAWNRQDPRPLTPRGEASIAIYGLSRSAIREERMRELERVRLVLDALSALLRHGYTGPEARDLRDGLKRSLLDSAPFSACIRASYEASILEVVGQYEALLDPSNTV